MPLNDVDTTYSLVLFVPMMNSHTYADNGRNCVNKQRHLSQKDTLVFVAVVVAIRIRNSVFRRKTMIVGDV